MADERISVVIDIDVNDAKEIAALQAALLGLNKQTSNNSKATDVLSGKMNALTGHLGLSQTQVRQNAKGMNEMSRNLTLAEKVGGKFLKMSRLVTFGTVAMGLEFAVTALSLASVNAAFAIGNAAMKVYKWGAAGVAGALAAAGAAALGAAAAFQQFQAAQYAFNYKDSKILGTGLERSSDALRDLMVSSTLASHGIKSLSSAYAAASKNAKVDQAMIRQLEAMNDFVSAGPDRDKQLTGAANFLSLIRRGAKQNVDYAAELRSAAEAVGPAFNNLFKGNNIGDTGKLLQDLMSGKLAKKAGVFGQGGVVNNTIFGQFKSMLTKMYVELADAGRGLLAPIADSMDVIFSGIQRTVRRLTVSLSSFGTGGVLPMLEKLTFKIEDFAVNLFNKYLPATKGWWTTTGNIFKSIAAEFRDMRDALNPLRNGGSVIIKTFGGPISQIFKSIYENVRNLSELAVKNKTAYGEFSERLSNIVKAFFEIGRAVKDAFTVALPVINKVLDAVQTIMKIITSVIRTGTGLGSFGGFAAVAGAGFLAYKGRYANKAQRIKAGAQRGQIRVTANDYVGSGLLPPTMVSPAATRAADASVFGGAMPGLSGEMTSGAANRSIKEYGETIKAYKEVLKKSEETKKMVEAGAPTPEKTLKGRIDVTATKMIVTAQSVTIRNIGSQISRPTTRTKSGSKLNTQGPFIDPRTPEIHYQQATHPSLYAVPSTAPQNYGTLAIGEMERYKRRQQQYPNMVRQLLNRQPGFGLGTPEQQYLGPRFPGTNTPMSVFQREASRMGLDAPTGRILQMQNDKTKHLGLNWRLRNVGNWIAQTKTVNAVRNLPEATKALWYGNTGGAPAINTANGGLAGAMAGGVAPGEPARLGLKYRLGRVAFGQSYGTEDFKYRNVLGRGSFLQGYRNERARQFQMGERPSRLLAIKGGLKNSMSMAGVGSGLATDMFLNSSMGKKVFADPQAQDAMRAGAAMMAVNPMLGLGVGLAGAAMSAKTQKGGMVAGAASGAAIGSMFAPVIGTIIGAGIGAVAGTVFAKKNQYKMAKHAGDAIAKSKLFDIAYSVVGESLKNGTVTEARKKVKDFLDFNDAYQKTKNLKGAAGQRARSTLLQPFVKSGVIDKRTFENMVKNEKNGNALTGSIGAIAGLFSKDSITGGYEGMQKSAEAMKVLNPMFDHFEKMMRNLQMASGKSSEEIMTLATKMNVDLYDSTVSLTEVLTKLNIGITKSVEQLQQSFRDSSMTAFSVFDNFQKRVETRDAVQAAGNALRGGSTSFENRRDYLQKFIAYQNMIRPNNQLEAYYASRSQFLGTSDSNGFAYQKGGALYGVKQNKTFNVQTKKYFDTRKQEIATELTNGIMSNMLQQGIQFASPSGRSLIYSQILQLLTDASGPDKNKARRAKDQLKQIQTKASTSYDMSQYTGGKGVGVFLSNTFGGKTTEAIGTSYGRGGIEQVKRSGNYSYQGIGLQSATTSPTTLTDEQKGMKEAFLQALNDGFMKATKQPQWWDNAPAWWAAGLEAIKDPKTGKNTFVPIKPGSDTSTPRGDTSVSRTLGNTLLSHNYFNGMLAGKRTITSSWRNYALGSPSSDHVTGRAYDLIGQNLGQYSSLINGAGGFAEFHGAAGSRHLHVVPPSGPLGDDETPKPSGGLRTSLSKSLKMMGLGSAPKHKRKKHKQLTNYEYPSSGGYSSMAGWAAGQATTKMMKQLYGIANNATLAETSSNIIQISQKVPHISSVNVPGPKANQALSAYSASAHKGDSFNITINDAKDPKETARLVAEAIQKAQATARRRGGG